MKKNEAIERLREISNDDSFGRDDDDYEEAVGLFVTIIGREPDEDEGYDVGTLISHCWVEIE